MTITVRKKLYADMIDNGLWPNEADTVLDKLPKTLAEVLNKSWYGYPVAFHAIAWLTVKVEVIKYIDENEPRHFARPMFE